MLTLNSLKNEVRMTRLDQEKRYEIYGLLKAGYSQKMIAKEIGVHSCTISRELKRNTGFKGYRPKQAQRFSDQRQKEIPKAIRFTEAIRLEIDSLIKLDWSPEQIAGTALTEKKGMVSIERIYQYIWQDKAEGGQLYEHLRRKGKAKKTYGGRDLRGQIKNKVSIKERPKEVDEKKEFGHWEIDLMVGSHHKGFLVTAVERVTKHTLIGHSKKKDSMSVTDELIRIFKPHKSAVKTITADNGKEFAGHERVAKELEADYYFANPYSSWERGLNENTNGLIRQYFPKGVDLREVSRKQLLSTMKRLNSRPRKTLKFKTPENLFKLQKSKIALVS